MQRSTTQVLYRYLPGAVFSHEQGYYGKVHHITGSRLGDLNRKVLLDEIATELTRWAPDQVGIPDPIANQGEFVVYQPVSVSWDVYPLTFECTNPACGRIRRWWDARRLIDDTKATGKLRCAAPGCGSRMRQLRYVTAHECGKLEPIRTPKCQNCQTYDNMYLDDFGSFQSSQWRCRGCGGTEGGMRFTPCDCGQYASASGRSFQTGYTARDQRIWFPQSVTLVNLSNQTYDNLQIHPHRGAAAIASLLGDETNLAASLAQLDQGGASATRKTPTEWAAQETLLRAAGIDDEAIEQLRKIQGPVTTGAAATSTLPPEVLDLAASRAMVERAGLYDTRIVDDRVTFDEIRAAATGSAAKSAASLAATAMSDLGIEDVSVTQRFPLLVASYGYTRCDRTPGDADLRTYAQAKFYDGKTPIFAVSAKTEALLVTLDAQTLVGFLQHLGLWAHPTPADARSAKLAMVELLAADDSVGTDTPAAVVRRLVHSVSHALVRSLDDGQSGFGESSLAEWIVPDALTTAVYVASYNEFTLGAFDTVLRRRVHPWLIKAADDVNRCDNDPMCSQTSSHRPHAACDRCLHLSFGCRTWNADLDRKLLRRFWTWSRRRTAQSTP